MAKKAAPLKKKLTSTKTASRLASKKPAAHKPAMKAGAKGAGVSRGAAGIGSKLLKRASVKAKLPVSKTKTPTSRVAAKGGISTKSPSSSKLLSKQPAAIPGAKVKPVLGKGKAAKQAEESKALPVAVKPVPSGPPKIHSKIQMRVETRWSDNSQSSKDGSSDRAPTRPEVAPLKKKEIDQLKELLVAEKNKLLRHLEEVSQSSEEHLETNLVSGDAADIASLEMTQANLQKIGKREGYLLKKIDAALEKISHGTYGACESCGEPISFARLQARPVAQLCIDCKTLQENEERRFSTRERGDEDDGEVSEEGEEG